MSEWPDAPRLREALGRRADHGEQGDGVEAPVGAQAKARARAVLRRVELGDDAVVPVEGVSLASRPEPRKRSLLVAACIVLIGGLLVARSAVEFGGPADQVLDTVDHADSSVASTQTTTGGPDEVRDSTSVAGQALPAVPQSNDVCANAAPHVIGEQVEYVFDDKGEDKTVRIEVPSPEALQSPVLLIGLHPRGGSSFDSAERTKDWLSPIVATSVPVSEHIIIAPRSNRAATWSTSATFDVDYLVTFFDSLGSAFCLDDAIIILFGVGQGSMVGLQAVCSLDLPIDLLVVQSGLAMMRDCDPSGAVPILSIDTFDSDPSWGPGWDDDNWVPDSDVAQELLVDGKISPKDAFDGWVELYHCEERGSEEALPWAAGQAGLERQTIVVISTNCDAGLVAFAHDSDLNGNRIDSAVMAASSDRLQTEILRLLK